MEAIAVVGLGNIANRHRKNLRHLFPSARIIAMSASGRIPQESISDCDLLVASIDDVIQANVDFAIIASPATCHAKHAVPLIQANIPVLIEKPVVEDFNGAEQLVQAGSDFTTPIAIAYCLRYLPSMQIVKQLLRERKVGQLYNAYIEVGQYLPDWRPVTDYRNSVSASQALGGGALLELSHEIDYAKEILGDLSLQYAILRSSDELKLDVEDSVDIFLQTCQGAVVYIHLDFLQKKAYRKCRFVGSQSSIEWDLIQNEVILIESDKQQVIYSDPAWDKNQMYLEMVSDFVRKINHQKNQCVTLQDAVSTVVLIDAIKEFSKG